MHCIKSRQQPSCSVFYHGNADVPIVLSLLSLKLGRAIRFDPVKEEIIGDSEAVEIESLTPHLSDCVCAQVKRVGIRIVRLSTSGTVA